MDKITINGKVYQAIDIDFNFVCTLEDAGISLSDIGGKTVTALRCYVATCMGTSYEKAGKAIQEHVVNGGTIEELMDVLNNKLEESDFFRALNETTTEETEQASTKGKKKGQEASE